MMQVTLEQTSAKDTPAGAAAFYDSNAEPEDAERKPESSAPSFTLVPISSIHDSARSESRANSCDYSYSPVSGHPIEVHHARGSGRAGIVCPSRVGTQQQQIECQ